MTKTDEPRDYTVYTEYDARIMWRDPDGNTGQIGPTFHSHDSRALVAERLNGLRVGLATDQFNPTEVSDSSFVVPMTEQDAKRLKSGRVTITPDGVEAGGTGVPQPDDSDKDRQKRSGPPKDSTDALGRRELEKGHHKASTDDRPAQAADQQRARDSKKDGPDVGDARKDKKEHADERGRRVTADR
jgi:hypothetical protein